MDVGILYTLTRRIRKDKNFLYRAILLYTFFNIQVHKNYSYFYLFAYFNKLKKK